MRIVRKVLRLVDKFHLQERGFTEEQLAFAATVAIPTAPSLDEAPPTRRRSAFHRGFSLHANVFVHANDREGLERICHYGLRSPFALKRMSLIPTGEVVYRMKRPLPDGTENLVLSPVDFLRRIASQVPPPPGHLVRYHGILGPHARDRSVIVPHTEAQTERCPKTHIADAETSSPRPEPPAVVQRPGRLSWAALLKRVFAVDVLHCDRCGGQRRIVAAVTPPDAVEKILTHLGLSARPPPIMPAQSLLRVQRELFTSSFDPCVDPPGSVD